MSNWTAASSDCSRPANNYVRVNTVDLYTPNARFTQERLGYQVLTLFGKLGYSHLIYMPSGYMAVHLMRPGRDPYAGTRPTAAEAEAAIRGYVSYAGPYSVHAEDGVVVHHQAGHLDPNRIGDDARRGFEFRDNQLILEPPVSTLDGRQIQTRVFWNRLSTLDTDLANIGNQSSG